VLGERLKPRHVREVVDVLRGGHQEIPDEPNPDLLNVQNGMLDWRLGDLHPHSPEHLSIIQLPVAWNPDATCPAIDVFLSEVLPADAQRFTREALGYMAIPSGFLRQAFMLLGTGSNGKSTFLSMGRRLLGRRPSPGVRREQVRRRRGAREARQHLRRPGLARAASLGPVQDADRRDRRRDGRAQV
jgi:putative DNA primase/helicase